MTKRQWDLIQAAMLTLERTASDIFSHEEITATVEMLDPSGNYDPDEEFSTIHIVGGDLDQKWNVPNRVLNEVFTLETPKDYEEFHDRIEMLLGPASYAIGPAILMISDDEDDDFDLEWKNAVNVWKKSRQYAQMCGRAVRKPVEGV